MEKDILEKMGYKWSAPIEKRRKGRLSDVTVRLRELRGKRYIVFSFKNDVLWHITASGKISDLFTGTAIFFKDPGADPGYSIAKTKSQNISAYKRIIYDENDISKMIGDYELKYDSRIGYHYISKEEENK